ASGSWLHRRLTETTRLSDLGASVDFASGMQITQGSVTKTADFSSAQTVQDLMSVVDGLDLGLRLEINEKQTGVNLVSEVSGVRLSVGESGGTTAADLGLRTLGDATRLSEFRDGRGVEKIKGENDFAIALHDGTRFEVDLDGLSTVGDVVGEIQNAAAAAGVAAGDFSVSHAATGNGLVFTDNTVGGDDFVIENIGESHAASHLGIAGNAGAGNTLAGEDHATVRVEGMFTHLIDLRDSLSSNDESGITLAGSRLEDDIAALGEARGNVGVQAKKAEDEKVRLEDRQLMEETMLSDLQDADLTEVITRFTQLQQQLQASLRVGAQNMQMNLMDFLR
ncbi:MAG: flagellin, partial [Phycisphaeraceae bacterium]